MKYKNSKTGKKSQLTKTILPEGLKSSPVLFRNQLAKELEKVSAKNCSIQPEAKIAAINSFIQLTVSLFCAIINDS